MSDGKGAADAFEQKDFALQIKEAERKADLPEQSLHSCGMEVNAQIRNAGTQELLHIVPPAPDSDRSCNSPSGSAVSALQSKFKEISQRKSKGKGTHDVVLDGTLEPLQKKPDKEHVSLSLPEVKIFKSSNSADVVSKGQTITISNNVKVKNWEKHSIFRLDCDHGEGPRMEKFTKTEDGASLLSKPTSSPMYWTSPKVCRREAKPEILGAHANEEEQTLKVRGIVAHKECLQKEPSQPDDILELSCQRERGKTDTTETENIQTIKTNPIMLVEGQYQPPLTNKGVPPSYEETDWDTAITHGSDANFRADLSLSPRHEHAKRLLERARLKARSQNQANDHGPQTAQREVLELLPMHNSPPQIITTTYEQKVSLQDFRSRNSEHGAHLRRQDQFFSHVHFKNELKKETDHHNLDNVCKRGLMLMDSLWSKQQTKPQLPLTVSQSSKDLGSSQGSVGIPLAILANQGDASLETVLYKDEPKKCKACGSILMPSYPKVPRDTAEGQRTSDNQWVTAGLSSHQIIRPNLLEGTMLTGSLSLDENAEAAGASDAGEQVSAFGKLRRRSRKGESRVEVSHGPYARGQELLAQRRNSRTRSSLEDATGSRSKRGVTFGTDSFIPTGTSSRSYRDSARIQLPIKSALKSGSKSRLTEQHGMMNVSTAQEVERSPQHAVATPQHFDAPSQVSQVSTGLAPYIKPYSLRYPPPEATPVEQVDAHSPSKDQTWAASHPPECWTIVRGAAMSKTENLRAELLRSGHHKAELQWDEKFVEARRTLEREGRPKLSLRRFFSAMGLNSMGKMVNGSRSSSMEQLSLSTARASPSPTHKVQTLLQRTPSLQTLHTESPLAQLRKASSVQSLQSPKKKHENSTILGELHLPLPLGPRHLHVKKGMEILDASQVSCPVGRIIQTFPDGSLLLELSRPANAPFGFVISKGKKGRPDSGVYVEHVGGSASENIYTSLLGVGDEILEINGEKVTGLSLDQVTCLMTRESLATVRIIPHRWIQY